MKTLLRWLSHRRKPLKVTAFDGYSLVSLDDGATSLVCAYCPNSWSIDQAKTSLLMAAQTAVSHNRKCPR